MTWMTWMTCVFRAAWTTCAHTLSGHLGTSPPHPRHTLPGHTDYPGQPGHPGYAGRPGHQGHLDDLDFLGDLENPGELGGLLDLGDLDDLRVLGIWKGQDSSLLLQIGKKLTR